MTAELHLPDLEDVPVAVSLDLAVPGRQPVSRPDRLRWRVGTYLPLLMMVALALATWWLVKIAPRARVTGAPAAVSHDPDYTMERFSLQRYDATGRLAVRMEGEQLRHFPDTDELEIETVRLTATAVDGRVTLATARHAVAAADGSVARLEGDARVVSQGPKGDAPVEMTGQRLVARIRDRHISTDQPVWVRQGRSEFTADAMDYDDALRLLQLQGKARAVLHPR